MWVNVRGLTSLGIVGGIADTVFRLNMIPKHKL